jgi:alpha-beta hydrolase superfamily lysophospholipase
MISLVRSLVVVVLLASVAGSAAAQTTEKRQTPSRPYPYHYENLSFENKKAKVTIAGTLTKPEGAGPFPAVILVMGRLRTDGEAYANRHRHNLVLADYLTKKGLAVLRCDKRGVGGSTGDFELATLLEFAEDIVAAVEYLKTRNDISVRTIGVMGHSAGACEVTLAATQPINVRFAVILSSPGLTGEVLYTKQVEWSNRQLNPEPIKREQKARRAMFSLLKNLDSPVTSDQLKEICAREGFAIDDVEFYLTKSFRFGLTYDPTVTLRKITCPVLIAHGDKDIIVDAEENVKPLAKALLESKNPDVTVKRFEGLNHTFQICKIGTHEEARELEETMSPAAMSFISDWITSRVRRR